MSVNVRGVCVSLALALSACAPPPTTNEPDPEAIRADVRAVLDAQEQAWNAGDVQGFLEGYWRSDALRFVSGATLSEGYDATLERYRDRYPDRAAMGRLSFNVVDIEPLGQSAALVFGEWRLERRNDAPYGLFTLVFRRVGGDWVIIHDHTGAAD